MIQVTLFIEQLHIQQTQSIDANQKISQVISKILQQNKIDLSFLDDLKCEIFYNQTKYDWNQTFKELNTQNNSTILVQLTKSIKVQLLNRQLANNEYAANAFDSIDNFKSWITQNYLRNIPSQIEILDGMDGMIMNKETWIENTSENIIQVFLKISVNQDIQWKGNSFNYQISVYSPIFKLIQNFKNNQKINEIISLQYENSPLKPEDSYYNHNILPALKLEATIPEKLIYRVKFDKISKETQIICDYQETLNEKLRILRQEFQIKQTSKLFLHYHWQLDPNDTFLQADIPYFSQLQLTEQEFQDLEIYLQNIGENQENTQQQQIERVNEETTLEEISSRIKVKNKQEQILLQEIDGQMLNFQEKKKNMKELNVYQGAIIKYKIVKDNKIGALIVNMNTFIKMEFSLDKQIKDLKKQIRDLLFLPQNQMIKFSVGTKLINEQEYSYNFFLNQNFPNIQVLCLETITIHLENQINNNKTQIVVKLEQTLGEIASQYKIQSEFKKGNRILELDKPFKELPVQDGDTLTYENILVQDDFKDNQPCKTSEPVSGEMKIFYSEDDLKPNNTKIEDDLYCKISVLIGEFIYIFRVSGDQKFEDLKTKILELYPHDYQHKMQFVLYYQGQYLNDETVRQLGQSELEIQLKLIQNFI